MPQFDESFDVFVHTWPLEVGQTSGVVAGHASHTPAVQLAPLGHWWPQVPQLFGSVLWLTHVPLHRSGVEPVQLDTQVCDDELQNVLVGQVTAFAQVVPHELLLLRSLQTPPQLT